MKKVLLAGLLLASTALVPARADVILETKLSGTGDNVVFDSLNGSIAVGSFNGKNIGLVDFTDLSGNSLFTGAQNGNDIKISNTSNLMVQVFQNDGITVLPTLTQVFSLKGTGSVTAFMSANDQFGNPEAIQTFSLGAIDPNAQSGFTFTAINGEVMTKMTLLDSGGTISDYEHYRIDGVPGPIVGAGIPGLLAGAGALWAMARRRRKAQSGNTFFDTWETKQA